MYNAIAIGDRCVISWLLYLYRLFLQLVEGGTVAQVSRTVLYGLNEFVVVEIIGSEYVRQVVRTFLLRVTAIDAVDTLLLLCLALLQSLLLFLRALLLELLHAWDAG